MSRFGNVLLVCAPLLTLGCTGHARMKSDNSAVEPDGGMSSNSGRDSAIDPNPDSTPRLPEGAETTLIAKYWRNVTTTNPNGLAGTAIQHQTHGMVYRPRQLTSGFVVTRRSDEPYRITDAASYAGWDVLDTHDSGGESLLSTRDDYLFLRLNRPATVAVVWYGSADNLPAWLSDWTLSEPVTGESGSHPVLRRSFAAGEHYLGAPEHRAEFVYTVLLSEADAQPSAEPPIPDGAERPTPNATCPAWVHDLYVARGPDGRNYRIWHPQIDPVYWCYFGHEHGSDPASFAGFPAVQPLFGYTAARANLDEPHEGYKVLVFEEQENDWSGMLLWHGLTGDIRRVCERYYTFDMAYASKSTGEVVANLHFAMDFGRAMAIFGDPTGLPNAPFQPDACPENVQIDPNGGHRNIVVYSDGMGYESWQANWGSPAALPIDGTITVVHDEPIMVCADDRDGSGQPRCNTSMGPVGNGAERWFIVADAGVYGKRFGVDTTSGEWGTFYTDAMGHARVDASAPGAIEQYAKPGIQATYCARVTPGEGTNITELFANGCGGKFQVRDPWTALYTPRSNALVGLNRDLEGSIQTFN